MNPTSQTVIKINHIMGKAPEKYQREDYNKLSRDQFEALIPKIVPKIISEDIAFYFNYLKTNRNKKSLKEWENTTGCSDNPSSYKTEDYRPIFAFLYYDRITEGMFLPLLLNKIEIIASHQEKEISIEEFNKLSRSTLIGFKPKIDSIDLKILQTLSEEPELVTQEITDKIEHSYATVYHHLQRLKSNLGLRITTRVNWAKLGVQRMFLITTNKQLFDSFKEFKPFLDGESSFLWGGMFYLRYYFLREDLQQKFIQKFESITESAKSSIKLYQLIAAPLSGYSFKLYNLEDQKWDFDFAATFFKPTKIEDKTSFKEREIFPDTFPPKEKYELTDLEIKAIEGLVGNYTLSQKEIADLIGIHAPNLSVIKSKLQKDDIISPQLMIRSFLPLNCLMWCSSSNNEIINTIVALLQRMPYSNISPVKLINNSKDSELICYLLLDDVLYYSLVSFLMDLMNDKLIFDFRIGLLTDQFFGMSKIKDILLKEI